MAERRSSRKTQSAQRGSPERGRSGQQDMGKQPGHKGPKGAQGSESQRAPSAGASSGVSERSGRAERQAERVSRERAGAGRRGGDQGLGDISKRVPGEDEDIDESEESEESEESDVEMEDEDRAVQRSPFPGAQRPHGHRSR